MWTAVQARLAGDGFAFDPAAPDTAFFPSNSRVGRRLLSGSLGSEPLETAREWILRHVPPWRQRWLVAAGRNVAVIGAIREAAGAEVMVDATKDPVRLSRLLRLPELSVTVIHLVRSPLGFVSSARKNSGASLDQAIRWWNRSAANAERLRSHVPSDRWLLVRYEDLCSEPQQVAARVAAALGVPDQVPDLSEIDATQHHVMGNRMRMAALIEIRADESWRENLSSREIAVILQRTIRNRERFGYGAAG